MNSQMAATIIFWATIAALLYTYAGYPVLAALVARLKPRPVKRTEDGAWEPTVTMIIAAYNEERDLPAKLENTLSLDYPADKLDIIVASDCSTDDTDEIVRAFAAREDNPYRVRLHRQPENWGKTAAQNAGVALAEGEILLFSDATTLYRPDVVRKMVRNFADPEVGCVAGRLEYVDPSQSSVGNGAQSYWAYETFLKTCESKIGSLIGVSGCLYAVRRSAYRMLPNEACSDFVIATIMVEQGLRTIFEPEAVCTEETNQRSDRELKMRVRIVTQTFTDLWRHRAMFNPLRSGFYAVQLASHKVLRYFAPCLLLILWPSSGFLAEQSLFYKLAFWGQNAFYLMAAAGWLQQRTAQGDKKRGFVGKLLALPFYFVLANYATILAAGQWLRGERFARWEPLRDTRPIGREKIAHRG
jgi:cellulose synthase/poly-beta-1,6-N-acetylglucosamine synthase-like glycosyltransferase